MEIEEQIPLLEELLSEWKSVIGGDFLGYRNHLYRMLNFCFALNECSSEEKEKIIIAATFHDIGIWTDKTVDYIEPSVPPAIDYLKSRDLEQWSDEIRLMITEHHKLREYKDEYAPLVELFRKGDLVDFSLGAFKFGLPRAFIKEVKQHFPNEGFHKNLVKLASAWFIRHPLNPAPMMKW